MKITVQDFNGLLSQLPKAAYINDKYTLEIPEDLSAIASNFYPVKPMLKTIEFVAVAYYTLEGKRGLTWVFDIGVN